jgi:hypothetical protein
MPAVKIIHYFLEVDNWRLAAGRMIAWDPADDPDYTIRHWITDEWEHPGWQLERSWHDSDYSWRTRLSLALWGFGGEWSHSDGIGDSRLVLAYQNATISLPLWVPLMAFAVPPVLWLRQRLRRRRRARGNLCAECGYDLRGGRGPTCPECGAAVQRPTAIVRTL